MAKAANFDLIICYLLDPTAILRNRYVKTETRQNKEPAPPSL
jgi:hypothetical protein